jgi:predicted ester cyclase
MDSGMTDLTAKYRAALYHCDPETARAELLTVTAPNAAMRLSYPFESMDGPATFFDTALTPLATAIPDLERRDTIHTTGTCQNGEDWIGLCGYYTGTFLNPFLDIPPTGRMAHMRFHEFYRVAEGKIVEMQAIWDLPELMMQADAWPMAPSLGREWLAPTPATQDGLNRPAPTQNQNATNCQVIIDMLTHMVKHPSQGGPEVMELDRFWHKHFSWYGPAGIGTGRGASGFRDVHQIPFLSAMPDRGQYEDEITHHFFADGPYVAVTGWPNMAQSVLNDGWMGIAPSGKKITMRSLDFWRIENGLIRENWVLVDILSVYRQLGVDVLARMREFNKMKPPYTGRTQ